MFGNLYSARSYGYTLFAAINRTGMKNNREIAFLRETLSEFTVAKNKILIISYQLHKVSTILRSKTY
jgi:hypothetical protein